MSLGSNKIGAAGAQALAQNTTLTSLDLEHIKTGDVGAQAFAQNTTLTSIIQQSLVTVAMELADTPPDSDQYQLHQAILRKEIYEDILEGLTTLFKYKQGTVEFSNWLAF